MSEGYRMNYIIYGINRVSKDFMYIFDDLNILYLTDDINNISLNRCEYPTKDLETALSDSSYDQIIICDFDKKNKENLLQEKGFIYGKDYVYEEDFFSTLDNIVIPTDRKIAIWGTGNMCHFLLEHDFSWRPDVFIDSNKKQDIFKGRQVVLPKEIIDWEQFFVIIAVAQDSEIKKQLLEMGLVEGYDFVNYRKMLEQPSDLLSKTIFDQSYYDLDCRTMLNHLEILGDGNTRCCCTTFVSQGLDNVFDKERDDLWSSALHKIMCLSTENKTFTFCDKDMCPLFVGKKSEKYNENYIDHRPYKKMTTYPETIALGYDASCNLSCITCRKEVHFAKDNELEIVNQITDKVLKQYLPHCKFLILAGNGEVFASPAYRKIYEAPECEPQYIRLLSNGTLFSEKNWNHFIEGKTAKIMLTVSIDAATKDTYKRIRRGNFDILKQNMEFASKLRKNGGLCYFRLNFVVQKENYKEMIPFVEWGQSLGVDEVFFTKILNWGTYSSEEFSEISMMEQDGITPKLEIKEICEHPVMKSDIVDMGTIQFAHKIDNTDIVENYYMWELEKRGGKLFI